MNIENVIRQRLSLQTTQRTLNEEFGVIWGANLDVVKLVAKSKYKNWPEYHQKKFLKTLGGINARETKSYIDNLI
jgi:hypothetical protein